jgi:hypothetical protein
MAARTQTYSVNDWELWTYVPLAGSFVLDFSKLNGTDTLGATDGAMTIQDVAISSLTITEGSSISQGIFTEAIPATMSAEIIVKDFTNTVSKNYYLGTPIWITLKNAETYNDTVFLKNTPIFMGKIRSFNVKLNPESNIANISLEASSKTQDDLNVLLTILKDNIVYKTDAIAAGATAAGIPNLYNSSFNHFGGTAVGAYETKTYGEWLKDMILCDLSVCRDDVTPTEVTWTSTTRYYKYKQGIKTTSGLTATLPAPTFTFDKTMITDLTLDWDGLSSPTGALLTNVYDPNIVYSYGASSDAASGGNVTLTTSVDLKDISEMTTFGQLATSYNKTFNPVSITTLTAHNFQNLTFREDTIYDSGSTPRSAWLYPERLLRIGELTQINMPTYGFTNYQAIIVGRTIEVSNDFVLTTYNLWKGF